MGNKYPSMPGRNTLTFSAAGSSGETSWKIYSPYPAVGKTFQANFGGLLISPHFIDNLTMSHTGLS